ncbi:MAG: hypothetical protein V7K19_21175 [Nostoc sp.]
MRLRKTLLILTFSRSTRRCAIRYFSCYTKAFIKGGLTFAGRNNAIVSRCIGIVSRNNAIVSRNNRIVSRCIGIVSRNNGIVSRCIGIVNRNNRIVSRCIGIARGCFYIARQYKWAYKTEDELGKLLRQRMLALQGGILELVIIMPLSLQPLQKIWQLFAPQIRH